MIAHLVWEYLHHFPALHYMHGRHAGNNSISSVTASTTQLGYAINFGIISIVILVLSAFKDLKILRGERNDKELLGIKLFLLSCCMILIGAILQSLQADLGWFVVPTIFFGWALADLIRPAADTGLIKRKLLVLLIAYYVVAGIVGYQHRANLQSHKLPKESVHEMLAKDITELYHQRYHENIQ